jgi:Ran GTPase-activating protein (RanGAP) involved in mRNA processing and transport
MLASDKTIAILDLNDNAIDDVGAKVIATCLETNSTMTDLDLNGNSIDDVGLVYISRSLEVNKGLTKLDIGCNTYGKEGIRELANALVRNTSLRSLAIGKHPQSEYSAEYLNAALKYNTTLTDLQIGVQTGGTTESGLFHHGVNVYPDICLSITSMLEQNREFRPRVKIAVFFKSTPQFHGHPTHLQIKIFKLASHKAIAPKFCGLIGP